ncbi:hypothetical protein C8Q74DRAFT_1256217 [Fomes fomentarius]|nr:hypothetical protein C8Q74DRAFT_1256217 [Fomes fomentarius]
MIAHYSAILTSISHSDLHRPIELNSMSFLAHIICDAARPVALTSNMSASETGTSLSDPELIASLSTPEHSLSPAWKPARTALSCIFDVLTERPDVQAQLRAEINDDLVKLPYLYAVIRETLRVYGPAVFSVRRTSSIAVLGS